MNMKGSIDNFKQKPVTLESSFNYFEDFGRRRDLKQIFESSF